jgi:competence protein ComEA
LITPLRKRQIDGLITVVLITAVVVLSVYFLTRFPSHEVQISHDNLHSGPVIIKLQGNVDQGGIYFLPEKATISSLLAIAGIEDRKRFDHRILDTPLRAGQSVTVHSGDRLDIGEMNTAERLALEMPIDLNRATVEDLMLVSGIGKRTAEKIVAYRNEVGPFKTVEDLKKVPGIKERKLSQLRKYFCIGKHSGR